MRRLWTSNNAEGDSCEVEVECRLGAYPRESLAEEGETVALVIPPPGLGGYFAGCEDSHILDALAERCPHTAVATLEEALARIEAAFHSVNGVQPHTPVAVAVVPGNHRATIQSCEGYVDAAEEETEHELAYHGRIGNVALLAANCTDKQFRLFVMSADRGGVLEVVNGPHVDVEARELAAEATTATVTITFRETIRLHLHEPDAYLFITVDGDDSPVE